jgi:hypothetical protein
MDLDEIMTYGRVVCVHADGSVSDAPEGIRAPQLLMGCLDDEAAREAAQASPDWDRRPSRTDCTGVPGLACTACGYRPAPGTAAGGEGREA